MKLFARAGDVVHQGDPLFAIQATEFVQGQSDLISAVSAVSTKNFMPSLRFAATRGSVHRPYRMFASDQKQSACGVRRVSVMLPYPFPGPFDYRVPPELAPELAHVVNSFDPWARDRGNTTAWHGNHDRAPSLMIPSRNNKSRGE